MEIGKAFRFVTEDEQWITKVLIGGLVPLIPIVGAFAVQGYSYRIAQNVARGNPRPLPAWGEFGDVLKIGFMAFVIQFVYLLPLAIIYSIFAVLTIAVAAVSGELEEGTALIGLLSLCFLPLLFIAAIVCGFAALAAVMRYLATDTFSEAFKFGEALAMLRNNIGIFLIILVVSILAGIVASLGTIACGIGVLFTGFYANCVIGHAFGQAMQRIFPLPQQPVYAAPGYYGPPPGYGLPSY